MGAERDVADGVDAGVDGDQVTETYVALYPLLVQSSREELLARDVSELPGDLPFDLGWIATVFEHSAR